MKIVIDRNRCIGAGMCVGIAPHLFQLDDKGKLNVLVEEPGEDQRATIEAAEACCPVEAISMSDA